ncbi:hypothetical protein H5410_060700 [Solanum commersonii]|uniref:Uncharacterized protein n=1 Tax=Solanum commersonii TaxID=4109 RepID=A0A9J5W7D2_SOLCO|nr:hypothetical protein H5410_060700 [Solanum commersonii]
MAVVESGSNDSRGGTHFSSKQSPNRNSAFTIESEISFPIRFHICGEAFGDRSEGQRSGTVSWSTRGRLSAVTGEQTPRAADGGGYQPAQRQQAVADGSRHPATTSRKPPGRAKYPAMLRVILAAIGVAGPKLLQHQAGGPTPSPVIRYSA